MRHNHARLDVGRQEIDSHADALPFSPAAVRAVKAPAPATPAMLNRLAAETADRYASRIIAPAIVSGMLMIAECVVLAAISIAVIATYDAPSMDVAWRCLVISVCGAVAGVCGIQTFGGYEIGMLSRRAAQILPVTCGWAAALAAIGLGLLALHPDSDVSRAWLSIWYVAGAAALLGARLLLAGPIRRWKRDGVLERRAVIVGGGQVAENLIRTMTSQPDNDVRICGIFDDRGDRRSPPLVAGYPKLGNIRELVEFARTARIDMLIVTLPLSAEKRVLELLKSLWVLPLDIRLSAHTAAPQLRARSRSFVGQVPLLDVFDKPIADWHALAKRFFDVAIAALALLALAPLLIATAIAVRLDSKGPIFFRQKRHGFNNQVIEVFKFRSMYHDLADPAARRVVTKGDPRVTRVGRFIRKASIDELPQLWNVLRGELSLVGPRPHAVHAFSSSNEAFIEIVDDYFGRHKVKPGITGWAQVNGYRGEIDQADKLRKRFEYDLHYIDNWSILFDVAILLKTPFSLLNTENAY